MESALTLTDRGQSEARFKREIRARIESLSYLPTATAVAMKFIELGKNPDAEPADYAKIISADSSLSSKILALANSSWAGTRHKVTTVRMAVNLLGLGTVRTLAISYCMTGLHNELRLSPEESHMFWESSLCKAVAAKKYASLLEPKLADEAFVVGLFQDFALPVMYATAREQFLRILQDPEPNILTQLQQERELFGMNHAEAGRILAQKLQLPDMFVDAVVFHHRKDKLAEFIEHRAIADAIFVASLFPHTLNAWHRDDAAALEDFLKQNAPLVDDFVGQVQAEFNQMYSFFHEGCDPDTDLTDLLARTTREVADNTTNLVGTVNELMRQAASTSLDVVKQHEMLEDQSKRDALTGALNRVGFTGEGEKKLAESARYRLGFAVVYVDIDKFKGLNDRFGHEFGDAALTAVVDRITALVSEGNLIGRMGGDEFLLLLNDCTQEKATQVVQRIIADVATMTIRVRDQSAQLTLSAGLLYVSPSNKQQRIEDAVRAADKLMYVAKRAGGNQVAVGAMPA